MPELGDGILGRHLLAQSMRLGPGEFHSLREYVPGDEPRTIHWRASARSDELKVRQHSAEGLRRCTVVLDQQVPRGRRPRRGLRAGRRRGGQPRPQRRPRGIADPLRHHRRRRPARPDGVGAHVAPPRPGDRRPTPADAARTRPGRRPRPGVRHHPGRHDAPAWQTMDEMRDPSLTRLGVFTESTAAAGALHVDATSSDALLESWHALVGHGAAAVRSTGRRPRRRRAARRSPYDGASGDRRDARSTTPGHRPAPATTGGGDANEPFEVARRPRSRRHRRPARLLDRRRRRVQPGVRRPRLPARPRADRRHRPRDVVPAAPAPRAGVRRHPAGAVVLTWTVAWIYYPETFSGPFPLSATWETVRADFRVIQREFQTATAPVPTARGGRSSPGDDGCRRLAGRHVRLPRPGTRRGPRARCGALRVHRRARRRREPCGVQLARDRHRLRRARRAAPARDRARATVLGNDRHPLARADRAARGATAIVLAGAWAIAPHLPGADAEPWFDTHNDRGGVTEIISPWSTSATPRQPGEHRAVHGAGRRPFVLAGVGPAPHSTATRGTFPSRSSTTRRALEQGAPARSRTTRSSPSTGSGCPRPGRARPGLGVRGLDGYDSHVVVARQDRLAARVRRHVRHRLGDAAIHRRCAAQRHVGLAARRHLPRASRRPSAGRSRETARRSRPVPPTNFDKMLVLQNWFRDNFTYDPTSRPATARRPSWRSSRTSVGYCEQFAGTFAAMARALGMPARVAVGFTQGDRGPTAAPRVGKHAHAWPEVCFDGFGWVPFEPTPGRGLPGAEAYTGVPPQQDTGRQPPHHDHHHRPVAGAAAQPATPPPPPAEQTPPPDTADSTSFPVAAAAGDRGPGGAADAGSALVRRWRRPAPRVGLRSCSCARRVVGPRPARHRRGRGAHRPRR